MTWSRYVKIDMNPVVPGRGRAAVAKDAMFISPHKFIGGVGTPGILIAKTRLFHPTTPHVPGGGSVFYVTREDHRYLKETELREEAGTPGIVESIRCGLVFQLKQAVGVDYIAVQERTHAQRGFEELGAHPSIELLGPGPATARLPIFSFLVRHAESGLFLHHNFVAALLNDMFGIQARGGCACAGPYAQELMGIDHALSKRFELALLHDPGLRVLLPRERDRRNSGKELLRPGFVRVSLNYFVDDDQVQFVLAAIRVVAELGWCCLPHYVFNPDTGEWKHRKHDALQSRTRRWLGAVTYTQDGMRRGGGGHGTPAMGGNPTLLGREYYDTCLAEGTAVLRRCRESPHLDMQGKNFAQTAQSDQASILSSNEEKRLRWFLYPSEATEMLCPDTPANDTKSEWTDMPLTPKIYTSGVPSAATSVWDRLLSRACSSTTPAWATYWQRNWPPQSSFCRGAASATSVTAVLAMLAMCKGSSGRTSANTRSRSALALVAGTATATAAVACTFHSLLNQAHSARRTVSPSTGSLLAEKDTEIARLQGLLAAINGRRQPLDPEPEPKPESRPQVGRASAKAGKAAKPHFPQARAGPPPARGEAAARRHVSGEPGWQFMKPPKAILKKVHEAVIEHGMIRGATSTAGPCHLISVLCSRYTLN
jgi:hypothetical protein